MRRTLLSLGFIWFLTGSITAQVTISPTSLFIDSKQRYATFLVLNGTNEPQEVSVSYDFGYATTDEAGIVTMLYGDTTAAQKYSIADWIRGFPKRFVLPAGGRQVVRLTVKPPSNLEDGVYWARVRTVSESLAAEVGAPTTDGITAQIGFKFEQITGVFYRNGTVTTGLTINDAWTNMDAENVAVIADVTKTGNAPFLGTMRTSITDPSGNTVNENMKTISVYFDGRQRLEMDVSGLPNGEYNINLEFVGSRVDIPKDELPESQPVSTLVGFIKN